MKVTRVSDGFVIQIRGDSDQILKSKAMNEAHPDHGPSRHRPANANATPNAPADTGLIGHTRVETTHGPKLIAHLTPGDQLRGLDGRHSTVQHVLPSRQGSAAIRMRAPYYGLNQDLIIGRNQHIFIQSTTAEYLFGDPRVLVPAWVMKDNQKVLHHELNKACKMYQIQLDNGAPLHLGNCAVASLPKHNTPSKIRVLSDPEARALISESDSGRFN